MARRSVNKVAALTWLFLVCASVATYVLVEGQDLNVEWAVSGVMVIAAIKARMIVLHFMELKHAPVGWRVAYELWVIVATSLILGIWLFTGPPG
ncbi:MAG: cytochrome C oxidase subunit IV family protein [Panacagrimonas sp.]